jgi:hypothetical protein
MGYYFSVKYLVLISLYETGGEESLDFFDLSRFKRSFFEYFPSHSLPLLLLISYFFGDLGVLLFFASYCFFKNLSRGERLYHSSSSISEEVGDLI